MNFTYTRVRNTDRYHVKSGGRLCARFNLTDTPNTTPPACVHLKLTVATDVLDRFERRGFLLAGVTYLTELYNFVFHSVLEITAAKGRPVCRIYAQTRLNYLVYAELARKLDSERYTARSFDKWIEIRKKS